MYWKAGLKTCGLWHFITSWWTKILNRKLVPFFIWVAVICRGKSNLLSLCALRCRCQAVWCWLSEPWISSGGLHLLGHSSSLLSFFFPHFILSLVLEVSWGRRCEISEMVSLISASRTVVKVMLLIMYNTVCVILHVLQLFFSTDALGR